MVSVIALADIGRLFTATPVGVLERATVVFDETGIRWIGSDGDAPPRALRREIAEDVDVAGGLVTPGLVDAHCHPVYLAPRLDELALRTAGAGYAEIAAMGGGIRRTVVETRSVDPGTLAMIVEERLRSFLEAGTTTVEAKTGYDLTIEGELATVSLLEALAEHPDLPALAVTFMAAHAVPLEFDGRRDEWVEAVVAACPEAARLGATNCDVFADEGYFTIEEARTILRAGLDAGLAARIHADELVETGGAVAAGELGARSADHLLRLSERGARALADGGVVATLCPLTALAMKAPLPLALLREAGVTIALGSDHNPGQTGVSSMATVVWAASTMGMGVGEALAAATAGSAASLGLADRGRIEVGARADLVAWPIDHEGGFAWDPMVPPTLVVKGGRPVTTFPA